MAKLRSKLKKTLKEAEFVHADLEYHREIAEEAASQFNKECSRLFDQLPEELKNSLADKLVSPTPPPTSETEEEIESFENVCKDLIVHENPTEEDNLEKPPIVENKTQELKRLFRRIAEETHPDKVTAKGFSKKEIVKRIKMFKKAKEAFNDMNWYSLYQLALNLDIPLPDIDTEQLKWIEEDINKVRGSIKHIQNLTAWHWYMGNDMQKKGALIHYFREMFGIELPEL